MHVAAQTAAQSAHAEERREMLDVMPFDDTSGTDLAQHVSEEQAVGFNRLLHRHRGADRETGVERLQLPLSLQQLSELVAAIREGFSAGGQSGLQVSCLWTDPTTTVQIRAKGYRHYSIVHGKHDGAKQFKATVVLEAETLWRYCAVLPHLAAILMYVETCAPGRTIAVVHILDQSSDQAKFGWHVDNNPRDTGYGDIELSFVFCLTDGASSMQVAGKDVFEYRGAGDGCMFRASLWHALGHAIAGTVKAAVFLKK